MAEGAGAIQQLRMCSTDLSSHRILTISRYFTRNTPYKLDYPNAETSKASRKYVKAMKFLPVSTSFRFHSKRAMLMFIPQEEVIPLRSTFNRQFVDLLKRIFVYDPKTRINAKRALQHPWFKETIKDDGTEAFKIKLQKDGQGVIDVDEDDDYE